MGESSEPTLHGACLSITLGFYSRIAKDLHRPLVEDMCPRGVGSSSVAGYNDRFDSKTTQMEGCSSPRRTSADDENWNVHSDI